MPAQNVISAIVVFVSSPATANWYMVVVEPGPSIHSLKRTPSGGGNSAATAPRSSHLRRSPNEHSDDAVVRDRRPVHRIDFGSEEKEFLSLLDHGWVAEHGLHPQAVIATVRPGPAN